MLKERFKIDHVTTQIEDEIRGSESALRSAAGAVPIAVNACSVG